MHESGTEPESPQPDASIVETDDGSTPDRDPETPPSERLVPVSEARRYRKRAQAAETIAGELRTTLDAKDHEIAEQRERIEQLERGARIDAALVASDAVDLETARLLVQQQLERADAADVDDLVDELRERKPFLFRRTSHGSGALAPREDEATATGARLDRAASEAAATGRRQDLLQYLRLRRRR